MHLLFVLCFLFHHNFVWAFCFGFSVFLYICGFFHTSVHQNRSLKSIFLVYFHPFDPGFWVISESEDENSELRSYDSAEYESEEIASYEVEVEEEVEIVEEDEEERDDGEEGAEIEESDNDIEVMEILAEAQKQSQIEKRPEQTKINENEKIKAETETKTTADNSSNVSNVTHANIVDKVEAKVCMKE